MTTREEDLPRAVRKGPLITLTCECGERREVRYGDQWRCANCGQRFDTRKIPLEQYAAIRRTQIRYRLFPLISCLLLLAAVILFWIAGRAFTAVIAVVFLVATYGVVGRPFFRSRYRRALSKNLPTWDIKAD